MRKTILIFITFLTIDTYCQDTNKLKIDSTKKYNVVEEMATFIDSTIWFDFVKTIKLDSLCNPVKLYVSFTIDTSGRVIDSEFIPRIYDKPDCSNKTYIDKLKVDFESKMPVLKPARQNNKNVRVRYTIPVNFN